MKKNVKDFKLTNRNRKFLKSLILNPRILFNTLLLYLGYLMRKTTQFSTPVYINLEPTIRCNLKCRWCINPKLSKEKEKDQITFNEFKKIIENFPHLFGVKIQGNGEPFLNKDLFRMISFCDKNRIYTSSTTNGIIISDEIIRSVYESRLSELHISIDGISKDTYEYIRQGAKFEDFMAKTEKLLSSPYRTKKTHTIAWFVGSSLNIHELSETVNVSKNLGFDEFIFQPFIGSWGDEKIHEYSKKESLYLKDPNVKAQIESSEKHSKNKDFTFNIYEDSKFSKQSPCPWPWLSCFITCDGFVTPCCRLPDPKIINFGNILEKDFSEIWNNDQYRDFRKIIAENKIREFCKPCYGD